ncbi:polyprenyl diphosphate synthase [Thiotrichales bacterium 19S3-7]|nr:polyprenyl diphosphate synthase [Thiotrichales bacterium 19S3-7]MCF6800824.1 polyprenyl diphosphate synthase [Thiotrichales bacterium 19S3-11]
MNLFRNDAATTAETVNGKLPRHIAIIMDGNGRWAKRRFLPRTIGHKLAIKRVRDVITYCGQLRIEALTLFAFGRENWSRPQEEVTTLMTLFTKMLLQEVNKLNENNVCLRIIGDRTRLSPEIQRLMIDAEKLTENNKGLKLQVAIDYSGRWDIAQAVKKIVNEIHSGQLEYSDSSDIFENMETMISQRLETKSICDPDLFIRSSGEVRISNFMLWQLSYCELYFTEVLWPDFSKANLDDAIKSFVSRQRRFGKTSEQLI